MVELDTRMRVGLRVKELRAAAGVSQEAFANSVRMARSYFAEVETSKRNVSVIDLARIADGFGVPLAEFFPGDLFE